MRNGHTLFVHMKNNNPTLHDKEELNKLPKSGNDAVDRCLKIGLDIELRRSSGGGAASGRGPIGLGRKLTREQLIAWVKKKVRQRATSSTRSQASAALALATACMSNCWKPEPLR